MVERFLSKYILPFRMVLLCSLFLNRTNNIAFSAQVEGFPKKEHNWTVPSLDMQMVYLKSGAFMMGKDSGRHDKDKNEIPPYKVIISKDFWLGQFEVTQRQYRKIMNMNPSEFKNYDYPVSDIFWTEASLFCHVLTAKERGNKRLPRDYVYRLPTEAEWEYACRAGTSSKYSFGDNPRELEIYEWFRDNGKDKCHPVGLKRPNPWGLYDMHGNVSEMCLDAYYRYNTETAVDPLTVEFTRYKCISFRGGSYESLPDSCVSGYFGGMTLDSRHPATGFRIVLARKTKEDSVILSRIIKDEKDSFKPIPIVMGIEVGKVPGQEEEYKRLGMLYNKKLNHENIDAYDELGYTQLHWAARCGKEDLILELVKIGARIDIRAIIDGHGRGLTPLQAAVASNRKKAVSALLDAGADSFLLSWAGRPFEKSIEFGSVDIVNIFLERIPENAKNPNMHINYAVFESIKQDRTGKILRALIKHGGIIDTIDIDGYTPLHVACRENNHAAIDCLLKAGLSVKDITPSGESVIDIAAATGDISVIRIIFEYDAALEGTMAFKNKNNNHKKSLAYLRSAFKPLNRMESSGLAVKECVYDWELVGLRKSGSFEYSFYGYIQLQDPKERDSEVFDSMSMSTYQKNGIKYRLAIGNNNEFKWIPEFVDFKDYKNDLDYTIDDSIILYAPRSKRLYFNAIIREHP